MPDTPSVAVVDTLNSLLEAELNSIFRFMGEGSPYLDRASAEVRQPLAEIVQTGQRRAAELYRLVEALGGTPMSRSVVPEEQYLAYLSLKFLLPKLVEAKKLDIRRYDNAMRALPKAPDEVVELLKSHMAEHKAQLKALEQAAAGVAAGS